MEPVLQAVAEAVLFRQPEAEAEPVLQVVAEAVLFRQPEAEAEPDLQAVVVAVLFRQLEVEVEPDQPVVVEEGLCLLHVQGQQEAVPQQGSYSLQPACLISVFFSVFYRSS